jgi:hypothetical protein
MVQVHHDEGIANRIDPESCADAREGIGEALTGERIGAGASDANEIQAWRAFRVAVKAEGWLAE